MPFTQKCNSCKKESLPELDTANNLVYCNLCGDEVQNLNEFQKLIIKTCGQLRTKQAGLEGFSVDCKYCKKSGRPVHAADGKLYCPNPSCQHELDFLNLIYADMLRSNIPRQKK